MPLSIHVCSPVSWISWERRFLPEGAGSAEEFRASCLAYACGGGAGFSRTSWAASHDGRVTVAMAHPRRRVILFMGRASIETSHPARGWAHPHCYQMSRDETSVAPDRGEENGSDGSDSLTDMEGDGKLTEGRGVAGVEGRLADIPAHAEKRCKPSEKEQLAGVRTAAGRMKKTRRRIVLAALCAAAALPAAGQAPTPAQVQTQAPPPVPSPAARLRTRTAPQSAVTVDGSEAMFTTMCALVAAGFESNVSADHWTAFRAQMRERLRQQQGPAVDALREFYRQHELQDAGATLSRYLWFGLVTGPAPKF